MPSTSSPSASDLPWISLETFSPACVTARAAAFAPCLMFSPTSDSSAPAATLVNATIETKTMHFEACPSMSHSIAGFAGCGRAPAASQHRGGLGRPPPMKMATHGAKWQRAGSACGARRSDGARFGEVDHRREGTADAARARPKLAIAMVDAHRKARIGPHGDADGATDPRARRQRQSEPLQQDREHELDLHQSKASPDAHARASTEGAVGVRTRIEALPAQGSEAAG